MHRLTILTIRRPWAAVIILSLLGSLAYAKEWKPLFNGKDLAGWVVRSGSATYEVVDGVIVGTNVPMSPNTFLCALEEYSDFELQLEVKLDPGLNSGIQIRSQIAHENSEIINNKDPRNPKPVKLLPDRVYGYQVEIARQESGGSGGVWDEARSFQFLDKPDPGSQAAAAFKDGDWNHYRILCQGNHIQVWVNDLLCSDFRDDTDDTGIIGLQVHGNISVTGRVSKNPYVKKQVRFRNIRIKEF